MDPMEDHIVLDETAKIRVEQILASIKRRPTIANARAVVETAANPALNEAAKTIVKQSQVTQQISQKTSQSKYYNNFLIQELLAKELQCNNLVILFANM